MLFIEIRTTGAKVNFGENPGGLEMIKLRYSAKK